MRFTPYISSLVIGVFASGPIHAEEVQSKERTFAVRYQDGSVERFKARWQALRDISVTEHGGPAKPFEGKFIDDRRCEWNINARIERRLFIVSRTGQTFAQEGMFRTFNSDFRNQGSSFLVHQLRSENCNDAAARRDSDWNDARGKLLSAFAGLTSADFENLKAEMRRDAQVVSIQEQ